MVSLGQMRKLSDEKSSDKPNGEYQKVKGKSELEGEDNTTPKIVTLDEMKARGLYYNLNDYVFYGYRLHFHKFTDCFKSIFMLHNELLNIWTHLIPAVIFICLIFYSWNRCDFVYQEIANKVHDLTSNLKITEVVKDLKAYEQNLTEIYTKAEHHSKVLL